MIIITSCARGRSEKLGLRYASREVPEGAYPTPRIVSHKHLQNYYLDYHKKTVFRYGIGEFVYQISGLYGFSSGQEAWKNK